MYGSGINMQQCHTMFFVGVGYRFGDVIQAIHRIQRFQQVSPCVVQFLYTEAEAQVRRTLERKWKQHKELVAKMTEIIRKHGLSHGEMARELTRAMGVERVEVTGEGYTLVNNDCVDETRRMKENSVGLILTSIPFSSQYEYSPNYADFGHSDNNEHFFQQMEFLIPELLRVLQPGRIAAIHVKDRIVPGGMTGLGFQVVYPFHKEVTEAFTTCPECRARSAAYRLRFAEAYQLAKTPAILKDMLHDLASVRPPNCSHRFAYMGMKTIVTDVVRENNQTYRLGWSEQCKDGSKMGVGMPEYLLLFRKPPSESVNSYADVPVTKAKPDVVNDDGSIVPWGDGLRASEKEKRPIVPNSGYSRSRWQIDAHGFTRSSGDRALTVEDLQGVKHERIFKLFRKYSLSTVYNFEHHVRLGEELELRGMLPVTFMLLQPQSWSPEVWTDITRMLTLNGAQSAKGRELHLCPMQTDLADRVIAQMSNPGDEVYDPFDGIGTVVQRAILQRRRGRGTELTELSAPYFLDSCYYARAAAEQMATPTMFDLLTPDDDPEPPRVDA
jgi:DNA modification methylase